MRWLPGRNRLKAWSRLLIHHSQNPKQNHPVLLRRAVKLVGQPPTCGQGGVSYRRVSMVRGAPAISLHHNKNQALAASNEARIARAAMRARRSTIRASVGRRLIVCRRRQGPEKPNWHPSRHSPSARAHCGFLLTSTDDLVKSSDQSRNAYTAQVVAADR